MGVPFKLMFTGYLVILAIMTILEIRSLPKLVCHPKELGVGGNVHLPTFIKDIQNASTAIGGT
jgi:hypothetical protein